MKNILKCLICNQIITRRGKRFCSLQCFGKFWEKEKKRCLICNKETKRQRKFCSISCRGLARKYPRPKCLICGNPVRYLSSKLCSKKCQGLWQKTHLNKGNIVLSKKGKNHWHWKGGISTLREQIKVTNEYLHWKLSVFERDDWTCQKCHKKDRHGVHAHHIIHFSKIIAMNKITSVEQASNCKALWDIKNGICLCEKCHFKKHYY